METEERRHIRLAGARLSWPLLPRIRISDRENEARLNVFCSRKLWESGRPLPQALTYRMSPGSVCVCERGRELLHVQICTSASNDLAKSKPLATHQASLSEFTGKKCGSCGHLHPVPVFIRLPIRFRSAGTETGCAFILPGGSLPFRACPDPSWVQGCSCRPLFQNSPFFTFKEPPWKSPLRTGGPWCRG